MEDNKIKPLTANELQPVRVQLLAVSLLECARLIGVSKSKLYQMVSTERFGPAIIKFGKKTLVGTDELRRWIDAGAPGRSEWQRMKEAQA